MDGRTQTLSAQTLLGISAAAIILILILIVKFRIRALLTLVIASLLTALATGLPTGSIVNDVLVKNFGGTLGGVLRASGIGKALADSMADLGIPVLLGCFLAALALRIAQGSATVALTTAAALMAPAVAAAGFTDWQLACIVLATAAGSVGCSHFNDSGFWLVGRLLDMDVPTTLKTWTVNQTLIAFIGFALSALLFAIV